MRTKQIVGSMTAAAMVSFLVYAPRGAAAVETRALVEGNTAFALELYTQLKDQPGNLFLSPYSISTALGMTSAGARGETARQMHKVLHFETEMVDSSFGALQRQLTETGKQPGIELNIANTLWAQKGDPFLPAFVKVVSGVYQANLNQADFKTEAEAARGKINGWVSQQTKERIQDILPAGSLDPLTRLVLANAVYFKGIWAKPFDKAATSKQPFHTSATSQTGTSLMHHFDTVRYAEEETFQAVEVPYKNGELTMVILLPKKVDGIGKLENQLTPALISGVLGRMKEQRVEIFLPRFKLESNFGLKGVLEKMGMTDAFTAQADFSGIDGKRRLYLSAVFHKAWGEVNEEGTEAAAATAVVASRAPSPVAPAAPPVFRADHPFIFFIRHPQSGTLLFIGRFSKPTP